MDAVVQTKRGDSKLEVVPGIIVTSVILDDSIPETAGECERADAGGQALRDDIAGLHALLLLLCVLLSPGADALGHADRLCSIFSFRVRDAVVDGMVDVAERGHVRHMDFQTG